MRLIAHRVAAEAHYLLPGCAGEGPGVLALLAQHLRSANLPGTSWSLEGLSEGILCGKEPRPSLVIKTRLFPEHRIIVTYNNNGPGALAVSRYLVICPTVLRDLRRTVSLFSPKPDRNAVGAEIAPLARADLGALAGLVDDLLMRAMRAIRERARSERESGDALSPDLE